MRVTFLALCIESVTFVNIKQTGIWDKSSHPLFQYGGKENSMSVSNGRNPFSKMLAFTADLVRLDMDMIRVYISDICLLWPLGNVAFLSLGQMLERCLLWVDRGLGGWWGVSQNLTMHVAIFSTAVSQMFVGRHVIKSRNTKSKFLLLR